MFMFQMPIQKREDNMPKIIRMYDIDWDTCQDDLNAPPAEACGLPSELTITVNNHWNPDEEAADYLTDNYGFLVKGLNWEEVT